MSRYDIMASLTPHNEEFRVRLAKAQGVPVDDLDLMMHTCVIAERRFMQQSGSFEMSRDDITEVIDEVKTSFPMLPHRFR